MSDEIVLPKSGIVLTSSIPLSASHWVAFAPDPLTGVIWIGRDDHGCHVSFTNYYAVFRGSLEDCVTDADSRILALRRALAPSDARERVIAVLQSLPPTDESGWSDATLADAVLSALGLAKEEPHHAK